MAAIRLSGERWFDLGSKKDRAEARELTRGNAGVYLLRIKGKKRVRYIGSSVPGSIQVRRKPAPLRMWKTINRHFHACNSPGQYRFGSDNFCRERRRGSYELRIIVTPADKARDVEARAIRRYFPTFGTAPAEDVPF